VATTLHLIVWLGDVLPRVDDPWPGRIGLSLPFTAAGAGGVIAGVLGADAPVADRDRAARVFSLWGFRAGAIFYLVAFVSQVGSGI
jgi:hypothetical protein